MREADLRRCFYIPIPSRPDEGGLDWSGKPPPVVAVEEIPDEGPVEPPKTPVEDLLNVIFLQVSTSHPERSFAYVKYTNPQLAQAVARSGAEPTDTLNPGDTLPAPYEFVVVDSIQAEGVTFSFSNDEEREFEQVTTAELERGRSQIVEAGPDGAIMPGGDPDTEIPVSSNVWRPEQTTLIGEQRYQLGTDSVADFGERYPEIITSEVRHGRWRDPQTGRDAGVQLYDVEPGGVVSSHGGQSGDVIKSINGSPVTSASEAITYVKNNSETTSQWDVVVLRQGVEENLTFYSPPEQ